MQVSFKDLHPEAHQPKAKKNIVVVVDSIKETSMEGMCLVVIQLKFDLIDHIDHIKPAIRKSPDIVVIHTDTNNLQNNCNILQKAKKLVNAVKEADKDNSVKIAFSSIIKCEDEDFKDKTNDVNNKLKNYYNSKGRYFLDNSNIDGSCLNRSKLHLNRKRTAALAKNLCRFVRSLLID